MLIWREPNGTEKENCKELMWVKGTVAERETLLGVAYLWSENYRAVTEKNAELVNSINRDLNKLGQSGEVTLVGYMMPR